MQSFVRAAVFALICLVAAPVAAADLALDQTVLTTGEKGRITFKAIALSDCNLTREEATSLFSGALSREDSGAMLDRMSAKELKIPEMEIVAENGDHFTMHDVVAENIAKGGADTLAAASIDGVLPDDSGDSTVHSGAIRVSHIALPGLAAALRVGDVGLAAFRFAHLDWDGGDMSVVDKGTAAGAPGGNRVALHAGAAKVDQVLDAEGAPQDVNAVMTGLSLKMPPQSKGGAALSAFGYPEVGADAHFAGGYDAAAKTYRLGDYSLDLRNIGKIALSGQFSGMDKSALVGEKAARQQAIEASTVDWAQINVTDAGLFDKIVAYVALTKGEAPSAVRNEWRAIVSQAPLLFSGAPAIGATARELDRFIADPKTLTLRVKGKDAPLKVGDLGHIGDPTAFVNRLDVTGTPAAAKPAPGVKP